MNIIKILPVRRKNCCIQEAVAKERIVFGSVAAVNCSVDKDMLKIFLFIMSLTTLGFSAECLLNILLSPFTEPPFSSRTNLS